MTTNLKTGPIKLAVLNPDGSKLKTLYLPPPDKGYPKLEFVKKAHKVELETGDERTRLLGYIPVMVIRWSAYDSNSGHGYTIGTADGNRPTAEDLLGILSAATDTLKIASGSYTSTAGGFVADAIDVKEFGVAGVSTVTGLEVTFRGRDILATMGLGSF